VGFVARGTVIGVTGSMVEKIERMTRYDMVIVVVTLVIVVTVFAARANEFVDDVSGGLDETGINTRQPSTAFHKTLSFPFLSFDRD